jgi:fatty-acyl-CoA synthase
MTSCCPETAGLVAEAVAAAAGGPDLEIIATDPGTAAQFDASVLPAMPGAPVERQEPAEVPAEAAAAIYYTGGTTGRPKGVVHSQASLVAFHTAQMLEAEIRQHDRLLLLTPLAHAAGLFAQSAILRGATAVLRARFDADATVKALSSEGISWTFLVPTMLYRLLDAVRGDDVEFPHLATIVYGAAPISPTRLAEALDVFGPVFIQLYGQTECPNWGTRLVKSDHDPGRPELLASCGQASIHAQVKVVDDEGETVAPGETGEICLRSLYVLERYQRQPRLTEEKFLGDWIRTGDVGVLDADGYVFLKDRKADMVISGGMNVYCREVEDVLAAHPAVRAVAVIGIPHDEWGEAVHAVIVAADDDLDVSEVLTWARGRLAAYARPKSAELVPLLPETPFRKVDKATLRRPFWEGLERAVN